MKKDILKIALMLFTLGSCISSCSRSSNWNGENQQEQKEDGDSSCSDEKGCAEENNCTGKSECTDSSNMQEN